MDSQQLPKTLDLFLKDIYKEFPSVEKHPDYNFYYLFIDFPTTYEYLFCVIDDFLYNSPLAEKLNESLNGKAVFYNFEHATIINQHDFMSLKRQIEDLYNEVKKTSRTVLFYPVW